MITLERLVAEHPMLQDVQCGVAIGDGWCELVACLCRQIERECETLNIPVLVVGQVKEKFGGLRFYLDTWPENEVAAARVSAMVDLAESLSYRICEDCGAPGIRRGGGWIRTLCDACDEIFKRRKL